MNIKINGSWKNELKDIFETDEFKDMADKVRNEYLGTTVYPKPKDVFKVFDMCPLKDIKVVVLGQDPYHGKGQAHGLSFSVPLNINTPPSLKNILKEIESDTGKKPDAQNNLESWVEQGVFLLNAILTVEANNPASHKDIGWEFFTDGVIKTISEKNSGCVFLLWGNFAKKKKTLIDEEKHLILEAAHPSPFSAHNGFFGCKHFSKANEWLKKNRKTEIEW